MVALRLDLEFEEKLRARLIRLQPFTGGGATAGCGTAAVIVCLGNALPTSPSTAAADVGLS